MIHHNIQCNFRMTQENILGVKEFAKKYRRSVTAQMNTIVDDWLKQQRKGETKYERNS